MTDIGHSQATIKKYGRGYYRASFFFPKSIRHAIWVLYRFVRVADEIVDNPTSQSATQLQDLILEWKNLIEGKKQSDNITLQEFHAVLQTYHIPKTYTYDFLDAMHQDLGKNRYVAYTELEDYMHGSAVVVGYMISHVIGFQEGALPYARALAEAFQMTNFLRDIKADYDERGRIYIPQEDLDRFGVTEVHIRDGVVDDAWRTLMRYELQRVRTLYAKGISGIPLLDKRGQRAVYASALIYKEILDAIEKSDYDVFSRRLVVSSFRKTMLLCKSLWYKKQ